MNSGCSTDTLRPFVRTISNGRNGAAKYRFLNSSKRIALKLFVPRRTRNVDHRYGVGLAWTAGASLAPRFSPIKSPTSKKLM